MRVRVRVRVRVRPLACLAQACAPCEVSSRVVLPAQCTVVLLAEVTEGVGELVPRGDRTRGARVGYERHLLTTESSVPRLVHEEHWEVAPRAAEEPLARGDHLRFGPFRGHDGAQVAAFSVHAEGGAPGRRGATLDLAVRDAAGGGWDEDGVEVEEREQADERRLGLREVLGHDVLGVGEEGLSHARLICLAEEDQVDGGVGRAVREERSHGVIPRRAHASAPRCQCFRLPACAGVVVAPAPAAGSGGSGRTTRQEELR